jgi:hypothetical protein
LHEVINKIAQKKTSKHQEYRCCIKLHVDANG